MTTDAIGSRFGMLGPRTGKPLEEAGGPLRASGSRGWSAAQYPEPHGSSLSAWPARGPVSLAQGVQMGVAAAQAGLAAAEGSDSPVPQALADWLGFAAQATDIPEEAGASLQAWLDIATGHMALQDAARSARERAQSAPRQTTAQPRDEVPAQPRDEVPGRPPAEQGAGAALAEARRSFTTALERLDSQLEPALAAALARLSGQDAQAAAQSAAARMRRQPGDALAAQRATQLPGLLGLLRWDFTPLSEPLPDAPPARA